MKKTQRQKRHEEKNWMALYNCFTAKYMVKRFEGSRSKHRKLWDIKRFKNVVAGIIQKSDLKDPFHALRRGERGATMTKGVWFEFGNMTFKICGSGDGVKRSKAS